MAAGNSQEAHFIGIIGATGSGKSTELEKQVRALPKRNRRRMIIVSPKERIDNHAARFDAQIVHTISDLLKIAKKAGKRGEFRVVFVPTLKKKPDAVAFSVLCKIALELGDLTLIVEELHSLTEASNAPEGWRLINFMGRGMGVWVFGLSQRPASVDKAFMGSLSFLHVGRLPYEPDQKAMAKALGVRHEEVAALVGFQAIQRDMLTGKITRRL